MDLESTTSLLSRHGYKQTRQRRAVLEVVAGAHRRLTPAQVHAQAQKLCPELGLPTVYRTLEILEHLQIVRRIHTAGSCEGFAALDVPHGHHVVCVKCGRVAEFTGCNVSEIIPAVTRQTGFQVEEHFLELLGTCAVCGRSESRLASGYEAQEGAHAC